LAFPRPVPGLVISYAFLWRGRALQGREEGEKDRPCAVVLAARTLRDEDVVIVLPVTHTPPSDPSLAVEVPRETKRRLGLDDQRSWIVVTDANRFLWPGPDLRPRVRGDSSSVVYGSLPRGLFYALRAKLLRAIEARQVAITRRTE
jgi:hypothetical protein